MVYIISDTYCETKAVFSSNKNVIQPLSILETISKNQVQEQGHG